MESNYQSLGQVSSQDAGQIFRDHLRGFARQMISEVMAAEVNELCGPKHKPSDREFVSQYSQQTPVRDAFLSRDRSSHTMDIVRVAGGRKRIPQDLKLRRHTGSDCHFGDSQSGIGQSQNSARACFSSVAWAPEEKQGPAV